MSGETGQRPTVGTVVRTSEVPSPEEWDAAESWWGLREVTDREDARRRVAGVRTVDVARALQLLEAAVAERGDDYRYENGGKACRYVHDPVALRQVNEYLEAYLQDERDARDARDGEVHGAVEDAIVEYTSVIGVTGVNGAGTALRAGRVGCMIGLALAFAGVDTAVLAYLDDHCVNIADHLSEILGANVVTPEAQNVLRAAQVRQDTGGTWGEALRDAYQRAWEKYGVRSPLDPTPRLNWHELRLSRDENVAADAAEDVADAADAAGETSDE